MSHTRVIDRKGPGTDAGPRPVVHLGLHTRDLPAASDSYARLLQWRPERIDTDHGCYLALGSAG
jgi:predicted enzyme related to lactoylglutathione lyase